MKKIVIIGAGPAGLTAAYYLCKLNCNENIVVLEKTDKVGGLSRTLTFEKNKVDIGGHRYFSKSEIVNTIWNEILPFSDDGFIVRKRNSHIYYNHQAVSYPINISLKTLSVVGFRDSVEILFTYFKTLLLKKKEESLEDFYINHFGERLYNIFFRDYTKKLWGVPASEISPDWGGQRIRKISILSLLINALGIVSKNKKDKSLIDNFIYPSNGSGKVWETMASKIEKMGVEIVYNSEVTKINKDGDAFYNLEINCERKLDADIVISSMPLKQFICNFSNVPSKIYYRANALTYRDMIIVAIVFNKKYLSTNWKSFEKDQWIYVQQNDIKFGRMQILNNWSPRLCENQDYLLVELEFFCSIGDELWTKTDEQLLDYSKDGLLIMQMIQSDMKIKNFLIERIEKAYPKYEKDYAKNCCIQEWIQFQENIYCIGRNGQHRYNNMDHSMLTAIETANYIMNISKNKKKIWDINNKGDYHEE